MLEKYTAALKSRRLQAVIAGILVVLLQDGLGLSEQTTLEIVALIVAWVVGDSITKTQ